MGRVGMGGHQKVNALTHLLILQLNCVAANQLVKFFVGVNQYLACCFQELSDKEVS